TDFLRRAARGDTITTTAMPIHRGRTQQLWRVESADQDGRLIAQGQVRLANVESELPADILARYADYFCIVYGDSLSLTSMPVATGVEVVTTGERVARG